MGLIGGRVFEGEGLVVRYVSEKQKWKVENSLEEI